MTEKTITILGRTEPITEFKVFFQTPVGLFDNIDDAIKHMAACDMHPDYAIRPVSVAVTASTYEVCGA